MKWRTFLGKKGNPTNKRQISSNVAVQDAARGALKQHGKTFKDLARYDKGEKVLDAVPR